MGIASKFGDRVRSDFVRNVSILAGGTAFAQGISVLALPILTRLYSPLDFSILVVFTSFLAIVLSFSSLRLNIAIPLPESTREGAALLVLAIISSTTISILLAIPVWLVPDMAATALGNTDVEPFLWLLPIAVLLASMYNSLQYWSSRQKLFGLVARTRMMQAIGGSSSQLGLGYLGVAPFGLLFGSVLTQSLGVYRLLAKLVKNDLVHFGDIKWRELLNTLSNYKRFPIYSVPEALFNTGVTHFPILLIAASHHGKIEAGFLFLALKVFALPMRLIGRSVAQVFLVDAAGHFRAGTLRKFTINTMFGLAKVGGIPLILIGIISPFAFPIVFGGEWMRAGEIVSWLTPWFVLQFISSPVSTVLHVTNRLKTAMALQAFGMIIVSGAVIYANTFAPTYLIPIYAGVGALFYLTYCLVVLWVSDERSDNE